MRNVDIWKEAHIVGPMAEFIREKREGVEMVWTCAKAR